MKALILDGSSSPDHPAARAADALQAAFEDQGAATTRVELRSLSLRPCNGCFGCWTKRPGECLVDDDARGLSAKVIASDVVAIAGPMRFGSWGSLPKVALDRMIGLLLPHFTTVNGEVHHQPRYARYPRLVWLGVAAARDAESEALFKRLIDRNAINFHSPAHAAGVVAGGLDPRGVARELVAAVGVA